MVPNEIKEIKNKGAFRVFDVCEYGALRVFKCPNGIFACFIPTKVAEKLTGGEKTCTSVSKPFKSGRIRKNEPFMTVDSQEVSLPFGFEIVECEDTTKEYAFVGLEKKDRERRRNFRKK